MTGPTTEAIIATLGERRKDRAPSWRRCGKFVTPTTVTL
jgi:hypothetical protein